MEFNETNTSRRLLAKLKKANITTSQELSDALQQAQKVKGLKVDLKNHDISFSGDKTEIVEDLIEQYKKLFGQASVEMCKDAVKGIITQVPASQVPPLLK